MGKVLVGSLNQKKRLRTWRSKFSSTFRD